MSEETADHTVRIREDQWKILHREKDPGDSFADVLDDLLEEAGYEV